MRNECRFWVGTGSVGLLRSARETGSKISLCGQAPSDDPAFARFLVEQGINSISFNPDAMQKGIEHVVAAEDGGIAG